MAYSVSPEEHGLVQSLSRPGGNVTGLTMNVGSEIPGKQLQLLKELLPRLSRVAFLHSKEQVAEGMQNGEPAARKLGITLLPAEHTPTDYTDAFTYIAREQPDALGRAYLAGRGSAMRAVVGRAAPCFGGPAAEMANHLLWRSHKLAETARKVRPPGLPPGARRP